MSPSKSTSMDATDGIVDNSPGISEWHSIRPWTPPLSLSVREITSVSATFILSSALSDFNGQPEPLLVSLGLSAEDYNDEDEDGDDDSDEFTSAEQKKKSSIISDALAKGLSVNVNSLPWQRVLIRLDDKADEAVIIIYGLMPGRQYDIDLALVQGGQNNSIRRQVVTDELELPNTETLIEDSHTESPAAQAQSSPSTSPSRPISSSNPPAATLPSPGFAPLTLEDRLNQLQHTLTLITAERDSLTSSLKSARRDAQKADAALRSEIELLKRASERQVGAEHRARQKMLALQEAAKRAVMSTREMEEMAREMDEAMPALKEQRAAKEGVYKMVKEKADQARKEKELEEEKERKKLDGLRGEMAVLGTKMDRLNGKREKFEGSVIPELEEQLRAIEREIEQIEADPHVFVSGLSDELEGAGEDPTQRLRNQNPNGNGKPSQAPIQRPGASLHWPTSPRHNQLQPYPQPTHTRSSSSRPSHTPVLLTNPHRQSSLKSTSSSSSSSSPGPTAPTIPTSTLSSRAPPFEPSRSLPLRTSTTTAANAIPVQRGAGRGSGHQKWLSGQTNGAG